MSSGADEKFEKLCSVINDQQAYIIQLEKQIKFLHSTIEETKAAVSKYFSSQLKIEEVFNHLSLKKSNDSYFNTIETEKAASTDDVPINTLTSHPNTYNSVVIEHSLSNNGIFNSSSSLPNNVIQIPKNVENVVLPQQRSTAAFRTNVDDFKIFDIINTVETEEQQENIIAKQYSKHAHAFYKRQLRNKKKENPSDERYYCLCKKGCSRNCGCRKRKLQCSSLCHIGTNCELKEFEDSADPIGTKYIQILCNKKND